MTAVNAQQLRRQVLVGDAATQLRTIPAASIDMVLTSPPYFRLRDYEVSGQIGLEDHIDDWIKRLQQVSHELTRVLVPTGSFWLNVADTYAAHVRQGAARKSLLLGPERLTLALLDDGWLVRNKIVWAKRNSRPSSVRDRLTTTWEALYVFVRQPDYFFDLDALRQPHTSRPPRPKPGLPGRRRRESWQGPNGDVTSGLAAMKAAGRVGHPLGKNPGDVWTTAASNYRGAHHATFPVELASRAIAAGCPEARCHSCRTPWQRTVTRTAETAVRGPLAPQCTCATEAEPGLVLDPFFGAGTTAVAAERLGRDWTGIELNPGFANLAERRIAESHGPPP